MNKPHSTTHPHDDAGPSGTAWIETPANSHGADETDEALPHTADVVVVGAGITGLTTALRLLESGKTVVVLEQGRAASGTTGHSSAHLTTLLDTGLAATERNFSAQANRRVTEGMAQAIDHIEERVHQHNIDCAFRRVNGYYFSGGEATTKAFDREQAAAERAGLHPQADVVDSLPVQFDAAFRLSGQGVFDPQSYVQGLAKAFRTGGGLLFERTRLRDYHDGNPCSAETSRGRIHAENIILATHTPLGRSLLHGELQPNRSYLISLELEDTLPDALFWDTASPYHYMRRIDRPGQSPLLLLGGADHKTGTMPARNPYDVLEEWARVHLPVSRTVHRWSAQLYAPVDGFPYIGRPLANSHIFVATGFNGDGLTLGTLAAEILADLIQAHEHDLQSLLTPTRIRPKAAGKTLSFNLDTARHLVSGVSEDTHDLPEIDSGTIQASRRGVVATYRTEEGETHRFSARCPHMGCVLQWNDLAKSWDCPCHGGRFTADGKRLEGPPRRDLKPIS